MTSGTPAAATKQPQRRGRVDLRHRALAAYRRREDSPLAVLGRWIEMVGNESSVAEKLEAAARRTRLEARQLAEAARMARRNQ